MKNHLIIARYNEDIEWVKYIDDNLYDIYIYNKGNKIQMSNKDSNIIITDIINIGRESHTYLYHIIKHYDNLPEKIIFTQGHPFDHVRINFIQEINNYSNEDFYYFSNNRLKLKFNNDGSILNESGLLNNSFWSNQHNNDSCIFNISKQIILNKDLNNFEWYFNTGAIFGVSKKNLLKNNRDFYNNLLNILINSDNPINPPEGHCLERLWEIIFT